MIKFSFICNFEPKKYAMQLLSFTLFLPKLQFLSLTWFFLTQSGPNTPVLPTSRQYRCCSLAATLARLCYLALSECDGRICLPHVPAAWGENRRALLISAGSLQCFTSHPLRLFPPLLSGQFQFAPREQDTTSCLFHLPWWSIFFIPEITGTRVPPVYFLYRRHFTRHQRG